MVLPLLSCQARRGFASLLLFIGLWMMALQVRATHIRAGDIQAKSDTTTRPNPLRFFFKMIIYTDSNSPASQDETETVFFGDGTSTPVNGLTRASSTRLGNGINRDVFFFEHIYNAPGQYRVSFIGENRQSDVRNIPSSNTRNFYIYTVVTINPTIGANRSPVLLAPAIDRAARLQVFLHNPAAYDPDGDSLAFKLDTSRYEPRPVSRIFSEGRRPIPKALPNYTYPHVTPVGEQVAYAGPPVGVPRAPSILRMDVRTGQLVWNAPVEASNYNLAFLVEEWRRDASGSRILVGIVLRDMQIRVEPTSNLRPQLIIPRDTCVIAGASITRTIRATDPDENTILLEAFSGIFGRTPPASSGTFRQTRDIPGSAAGLFSWTTDCNDVGTDATQVLFKATDRPAGTGTVQLNDLQPWRITVVGPPPANLRGTPAGGTVQLTWDRYFCTNASEILIFRKENPSNWTPSTCETGIPASAGYTQVGSVGANLSTFTDDNNGRGLDRGKTYCYRIYAVFPRPAGGESLASREACVTLEGRAALFTNVTVDRTSVTDGQITVKWTQPKSNSSFFPPVGYRLYRSVGLVPTVGGTPIRTITNLTDTVHIDTGLDTENRAYSYRLEFFSNISGQPGSGVRTETPDPASSVRLETVANPAGNRIKLNWAYIVPWDNSRQRTRIFRRDPGATNFVLIADTIATRTGGTFTDRGTTAVPLRRNQTYCYYVETTGTYGATNLPSNLVNLSQQNCVVLASVPCTPVLTVRPINCDSVAARLPRGQQGTYDNYLRWTLSNNPAECSRNIAFYRVLFRPSQEEGDFVQIGTSPVPSYVHRGLASAAGCYAVVAVDSAGRSSAQSNIACQDNCLIFQLPNVFTPNGDGSNDTFRPIFASPVARAKVQIFNRWGAKVYEGNASTDLRLWDGGGASGGEGSDKGARAVAGTYYYLIEVEFADLNRTKRSYKGWIELVR